ncbi:unnamed protein product [Symbiodinium sp. CCMP2592]|nr:unnamed protein product [Symbiodinium sp. CCMP2592]
MALVGAWPRRPRAGGSVLGAVGRFAGSDGDFGGSGSECVVLFAEAEMHEIDVDESEPHMLVPAEASAEDRLRLSKMPDGPWTWTWCLAGSSYFTTWPTESLT